MKKRGLTDEEKAIVREKWPLGGVREVRKHIPDANDLQIQNYARTADLLVSGRKPYKRIESTEFIDAAIKKHYEKPRPDLVALSRIIGRGRPWIKSRAAILGVANPSSMPNYAWSPEEEKLFADCTDVGYTPRVVYRKFRQAGFRRTLGAIVSHFAVREISVQRDYMTATDVAKLFKFSDISSVVKWISSGKLKAKKVNGDTSKGVKNAAIWKIKPEDLSKFMIANPELWNHKRMEKYVLLDLLIPNWRPAEKAA